MIALDRITQLINRAAEAGFVLCRASELQPGAIAGFNDGEVQKKEMKMYLVSALYVVNGLEVTHPLRIFKSEKDAEALVARLFGDGTNADSLGTAVWAITGKLNRRPAAIRVHGIDENGHFDEEPIDITRADEACFTTV